VYQRRGSRVSKLFLVLPMNVHNLINVYMIIKCLLVQ
jgi:hypothetical protein